jgi:hypothetical protein
MIGISRVVAQKQQDKVNAVSYGVLNLLTVNEPNDELEPTS